MSRRLSAGLITLCLVLLGVLAACTSPGPQSTTGEAPSTVSETVTPELVPTPEPGLVTVTGQLVDTASRQPYSNIVVRLAEIIHIEPNDSGTWMIDDASSPGDYTDPQGNFIIPNVAAKEYVIVVGDFHTRYAIVTDTPDNARVWMTSADEILDVKQIDVVLP
jgi:hypothetical protein